MSIKGRVLKILAQREELFSMSVELRVGICGLRSHEGSLKSHKNAFLNDQRGKKEQN